VTDRDTRIAGLVEAAREGDREAVGDLVTEFSPLLWHVARAAGLTAGDAEDVLQTVWLRLLTHLDGINSPAALGGWLVTTTRRESWRVRGLARRQVPAAQDWLAAIPDPGARAEDLAVSADSRRELAAALRQLSARCQELLRIVAFVPRPDYDVIAVRLGMPRGSIGPTRGRCLARLRAILDSCGEGSPG
jgi:RNA polymerase sigma factor (sigma-70 family)